LEYLVSFWDGLFSRTFAVSFREGIPGTQMTLVLNGKGLLLEGSNPKRRGQIGSRFIYMLRTVLVSYISPCVYYEIQPFMVGT